MARARVNPVEIEEIVQKLPNIAKLSATSDIASDGSRRVAYSFPGGEVRELPLSPLPGRYVGEDQFDVAFRVQSVGCVEAQVILSRASRLAAHRKRSATRLRWDSASNHLDICDRLFAGMRGSVQMVATVRSVFKCAGGGAELLLVNLVGNSA